MKIKIIIVVILIIYNYCSYSQTTKCNDSLIMSIIGTWELYPQLPMLKPVTKTEFDQANKNMNAYHQLLLEAYPQGIGCEPQVNMINPHPAFYTPWVYSSYYYTAIYPYLCIKNKPVKALETNTTFRIIANDFEIFWTSTKFFINGQEVFKRLPRAGKWNGYDAYYTEEQPLVMLTRKDKLPYKPVTRKQYLDYFIHWFDSAYTNTANEMKKMPVRSLEEQEKEKNTKLEKFKKDFGSDPKRLKSAMDYYLTGYETEQQRRDEQVKKTKKTKTDILKRFEDELEKTTKEGLLDSPACIVVLHSPDMITPIFVDEDKGKMLVTDNPDYIRKDLPKHIPQFFVLTWKGMSKGVRGEVGKIIKEKFPIEKLQAMIDK